MSDSNRVRLAYVAETSYGVQKTGSPLKILRKTGESLKQAQQVITSNEIRSDRQITSMKRNNVNAEGDIPVELSYGSYDDLLLLGLMHGLTAVTVTASDISASSTDNSFNSAGAGFGSIEKGRWIQVTGFTGNPANNGFFMVLSATSSKLIVTGGTLVTDTAGESVTIKQGDWSATVTVTGATIAAVASGNKFTDSGNGFGSIAVGSWIKVSGFTGNTANNGFFKVSSKTAGEIVVTGGTLVDDAAGETVTIIQGACAFNGVKKDSINIERTYEDLSSELALFLGMMVEGFQVNVSVDQIITGSFSFLGKRESSITSSGGTGYTDPTTTEPVNAVDDVYSILENNSAFSASSFSVQLRNNLRGKQKIGTLGAFDVGVGSVAVTGTLVCYYESKTIFDKYLNQTKTSLSIVIKDAAGNAYVIDLPSVKFSTGQRPGGSLNSDVMTDLAFTAYMDSSELKTIKIAKFAA